ncbi:MAG TPA: hypothetical protein VFU23_08790 [Gemmatimonadales bacterium]|nr:hypothetical protein [Gemmatimonadales bacterium]
MIKRHQAVLALLALPLMGCYTLQPLGGVAPKPGDRLAFELNDAGRAALGGSIGAEVAQVEGLLVDKDNEGYVLSVSSVRTLRGGDQVWSGEKVRLNNAYVGPAYLRKFSTGRSIGLGVVGIGGFAAILATTSLLGIGNERPSPSDTGSVPARLGRP